MRVLVIDVGTHRAQEVLLFEGRVRHALIHGASRLAAGQFRARYSCRYVLVEPVMNADLLNFVGSVPSAILISGVVSCNPSGPETLLMARNELGNSIVPSKPGLTGQRRDTFNVDFADLYEFAVTTFVRSGDCDKIILRMNAEGVEGPIIDFLANSASVKPTVIAGSIGDIKKCFGQEAYDKAVATLADAGIPFVYLTSNPRTWASGLREIITALESPHTEYSQRQPSQRPSMSPSQSRRSAEAG